MQDQFKGSNGLFVFFFAFYHIEPQGKDMGEQGIGLIGEIGKRIIDRHIPDPESRARTGLIDPYFFLVQRVPVRKGPLEIIDPG